MTEHKNSVHTDLNPHTSNAAKDAIVLLSGGLDSTTVLAIALANGYRCHTMSFDYGQRNRFELSRATHIAETMGSTHHTCVRIDLRIFGGSSLTSDAPVERDRDFTTIGEDIPSTYVPARNTLFLSYALAYADSIGAGDIFIGVNAVDTSGYPDCRPAFIDAFETTAQLGSRVGAEGGKVKIHTPLQALTKEEIVRKGIALGVDYALTGTCYDPDARGMACGTCDACRLRQRGFHNAGYVDPVTYVNRIPAPAGCQTL